jgi:hypothetical protein
MRVEGLLAYPVQRVGPTPTQVSFDVQEEPIVTAALQPVVGAGCVRLTGALGALPMEEVDVRPVRAGGLLPADHCLR